MTSGITRALALLDKPAVAAGFIVCDGQKSKTELGQENAAFAKSIEQDAHG